MSLGTVTTHLNLRSGPGTEFPILALLDPQTSVTVVEQQGDWLKVETPKGNGFASKRFILQQNDSIDPGLIGTAADDPLPGIGMAPDIPLRAGTTPSEKLVSGVWNRAGGVLQALSGKLGFHSGVATAVFCTESGGKGFAPDGRMIIRFENHHFFKHWGNKPDNRADFEEHFRFDSVKPWKNHTWTPGGRPFEPFHGKQALEWQVFDFASTRDAHAAKLSISMGGPQILGSNFTEMGFESVEQMFDAFASNEKRQIVGFFDFVQGTGTSSRKVQAMREQNFIRFAELYNGAGNASEYGSIIEKYFDDFQRLSSA
jgi:hypothetical protein